VCLSKSVSSQSGNRVNWLKHDENQSFIVSTLQERSFEDVQRSTDLIYRMRVIKRTDKDNDLCGSNAVKQHKTI